MTVYIGPRERTLRHHANEVTRLLQAFDAATRYWNLGDRKVEGITHTMLLDLQTTLTAAQADVVALLALPHGP